MNIFETFGYGYIIELVLGIGLCAHSVCKLNPGKIIDKIKKSN